jgi:hypothetical protein
MPTGTCPAETFKETLKKAKTLFSSEDRKRMGFIRTISSYRIVLLKSVHCMLLKIEPAILDWSK